KPKIEARLKTGQEEMARRRFPEAIKAFEEAKRLDSTNAKIQELLDQARTKHEHSQRATQLVTEARKFFDQQNLPAAYKCASEALLLDPENPQAERLLVVIQSAIDRKRQQQQLDDALLNAERLLMRQDYDKALHALEGLPSDARVEQ